MKVCVKSWEICIKNLIQRTLGVFSAELKREKDKNKLEDPSIVILVNVRRVDFIRGLNASLKDMDEVVVMPIIAGG